MVQKWMMSSGSSNRISRSGSAFLTQVDEVHHRRSFERHQSDTVAHHIESYRAYTPTDPQKFVEGLIESSRAQLAQRDQERIAQAKDLVEARKAALQTLKSQAAALDRSIANTNALIASLEAETNALQRTFETAKGLDLSGQPAQLSPSALRTLLVNLAERDLLDPALEKEAEVRLAALKALDSVSTTDKPREEARTNLLLTVRARRSTVGKAKAEAEAALPRLDEQKKAVAEALTKGQQAVETANQELTGAQNRPKESNLVLEELRTRAGQLASQLNTAAEQRSADAGIVLLAKNLSDAVNSEQGASKKGRLEEALALVKGWPQPGPGTALPSIATAGSGSEVWEALIAQLQFQHTFALQNGQQSTATAIESALADAYTFRSGLGYLRPASSFLRNSYPVTAFQKNQVAWKNMLSQQARRQLPFAGMLRENGAADLKALQQIDNQFWHNVNRIRVAGGGKSNYVLAKDDVGNWYVKEYAVDITQVANSMQKVAMFGLGPSVGAPGAFNLARSTDGTAAPPKSAYREQYELFTRNFAEETKKFYLDASTNLTRAKTKQKILSAWKNTDDQQLRDALDRAGEALIDLPPFPDTPKETTDNLLKLAGGFNACYDSLKKSLPTEQSTHLTAAKESLAAVFKQVQGRRQEITSEYENALKVIAASVAKRRINRKRGADRRAAACSA